MQAQFGPGGNSEEFYDSGKKSTLDAPAWVREKGLDAYEYQGGKGIFASQATLAAIGKAAAENGIKMSLHAQYYISLSSVDPDIRAKSVDYVLQAAAAADLLGATVFVVHAGSSAKLDREEAMKLAEHTVADCALALREGGFRARMGLETMGKINQLGTVEEIVRLCRVDPEICRPVVDWGHLNARTLGGMASRGDFEAVFETISAGLGAAYAETLHCHFSKIEYTKMGEKKHLKFSDDGEPDYRLLLDTVRALNVFPTLICESDGTMASDALTMKQYYNGSAV